MGGNEGETQHSKRFQGELRSDARRKAEEQQKAGIDSKDL